MLVIKQICLIQSQLFYYLLLRPMNCSLTHDDIHICAFYALTVPQEVEQYRTFLTESYECVQTTKDQWPPVLFKEYIKLATVVKVEDFMEEDRCTKAMMNGKLRFVMKRRKSIAIKKVSHRQSYILRVTLLTF